MMVVLGSAHLVMVLLYVMFMKSVPQRRDASYKERLCACPLIAGSNPRLLPSFFSLSQIGVPCV
jgi:hypothetical protein